MKVEADKQDTSCESLSGHAVYIIGANQFYIETLGNMIEARTGAQCTCVKNMEEISEDAVTSGKSIFFLFDLLGKSVEEFTAHFLPSVETIAKTNFVVMFNIRSGLGIEESSMDHGIRGVFYENDSLSVFLKGINAIYNGELWFSRGTMTKFILEDKENSVVSIKVRSILTQREIEIISLVAVGCRNEEIAEKLCVSPHTIKTHLYNIYKKINVTNRLQATLWAANNL